MVLVPISTSSIASPAQSLTTGSRSVSRILFFNVFFVQRTRLNISSQTGGEKKKYTHSWVLEFTQPLYLWKVNRILQRRPRPFANAAKKKRCLEKRIHVTSSKKKNKQEHFGNLSLFLLGPLRGLVPPGRQPSSVARGRRMLFEPGTSATPNNL